MLRMLCTTLRWLVVSLVLAVQLLVLFLPVLEKFARWARAAGDVELHTLAVRRQAWLLRHVLPARFDATLVEPRLYVGSLEDAHSVRGLHERRIRSILTAAAEATSLQPDPLPPEDFTVLQIGLGSTGAEFKPGLRHSLPFLHDALARKGGRSVLVHSFGGNGRACAVAAGFVMQARGLSFEAALAQVRAARPAALTSPTSEAVWIPELRAFEAELRQRGLLTSPSPPAALEDE